jgi:hypothetical protein
MMARDKSANRRSLKGVCFGHLARFKPSNPELAVARLDSVFGSKVESDQLEQWVKEWWEKANTPAPVSHQSDYSSLLKARLLQAHLGDTSLEDFTTIFSLVEELGGLQNAQRALEALEYLQNVGTSTTAVRKLKS